MYKNKVTCFRLLRPRGYVFLAHMSTPANKPEVGSFIIDDDDDNCPNADLHKAAYNNDFDGLRKLLQTDEHISNINTRVRPFMATPLRLAATGTMLSISEFACVDIF